MGSQPVAPGASGGACSDRAVGRRAAEGRQDKQTASAMQITPKKVSRWSSRFLTLGMAGLERDASRLGRTLKITASLVRRVVRLTTQQKPANATH